MKSRHRLFFLGLLLLCVAGGSAQRPNVVFLLSDDQRSDTIQALGNSGIVTPNLDRLVAAGSTFTRTYCQGSTQGAVCVPSRAMLLTGRSLFRALESPGSGKILTNYVTWPELFRNAGYRTIGIGKWHNDKKSYARAFSEGGPIYFGGMSIQNEIPVHAFDPSGEYPDDKKVVTNVFSSELFAEAAVDFLKGHTNDQPFLMYVSFTAPHDPRSAPAKFHQMYSPARMRLPPNFAPTHPFDNGELKIRDEHLLPWPRTAEAVRKELADYYAAITHMDAQIGKILDQLVESGLASNTIIVFASDHGLAIGSHGLMGKQNLYEHSTRTPLVMAGPGIPRNRRFDALAYLYDLYPTLCHLTGVRAPATVEGLSLMPVLSGQVRSRRSVIFGAYRDSQRSIRGLRWKMIVYPGVEHVQVYDLVTDPHERRNLAGTKRARQAQSEMAATLRQVQAHLDDPLRR